MPCNSDYMEARPDEVRAKLAAELVLWLTVPGRSGKLLMKTQQRQFEKQAANYYATDVGQTKTLCNFVKSLREGYGSVQDRNILDEVLQDNFKDPMSRKLADWIDEHDEADRRRAESDASDVRRKDEDVITRAIKELSPESLAKLKEIFTGLK